MELSTIGLIKNSISKNSKFMALDDNQMQDLQKTTLSIADDIISVCDQFNINYKLFGGTCLGAIRHNGFIPWDDDIDIAMARKDYNKFIEEFSKKYGDKYFIHNFRSESTLATPCTQIRLKDTIVRTFDDMNPKECGAFVDINIIDNTYDNKIMRKIHGTLCMGFGLIVSCSKYWTRRKFTLSLVEDDKEATKVFKTKIVLGFFFAFLTCRRWNIIYDKICGMCHNENSKYVVIPTGVKHFWGEMHYREDFYENEKHEFEGRNWNVPKSYDKYLKSRYGDYMKIPKEGEREKHVVLSFNLHPTKEELEKFEKGE